MVISFHDFNLVSEKSSVFHRFDMKEAANSKHFITAAKFI